MREKPHKMTLLPLLSYPTLQPIPSLICLRHTWQTLELAQAIYSIHHPPPLKNTRKREREKEREREISVGFVRWMASTWRRLARPLSPQTVSSLLTHHPRAEETRERENSSFLDAWLPRRRMASIAVKQSSSQSHPRSITSSRHRFHSL
jgi:hypothetical protein